MPQGTAIILAGPTASGKTAMAIRLAQHYQTAIISADSRQCFKELTIGTAKPSEEELHAVKHYFINSHSITEEVNAGIFETLSLGYAQEVFARHPVVIVCGGTGLYLKAFSEGIERIPPVPAAIRDQVQQDYAAYGLPWLQEELRQKDPLFYRHGEIQNPQRLMRALEVFLATGESILRFRKGAKASRNFNILKIGLTLPKGLLHERIDNRVDHMIRQGLVNEVKALVPFRNHNALQTVGYKEMFAYIDGKISLEKTIDNIKIHTRQYAKRQMTWFRKDEEIVWYNNEDSAGTFEHLSRLKLSIP